MGSRIYRISEFLKLESAGGMVFDERLGIVIGSLLSGIAGYFILKKSLPGAS